jgi:hypothetical protein
MRDAGAAPAGTGTGTGAGGGGDPDEGAAEMTSAIYPAAISQRLLWQAAFRSPSGATGTPQLYSIPDLDATALQRALTELRSRHEALRTRLVGVGARLTQEISDPSPLPLEWVDDGDDLAPADRGRRGPGDEVIARVQRQSQGGSLLLDVDHLLADAWSCNLLGDELSLLYKAYREGREPVLPAVGWQYRHFAEWQLGRLSGDSLHQMQASWLARLDGAESARLPRPASRVPRRGRSSVIRWFGGGSEAARALAQLRAVGGTTLSAAAVTMFFVQLGLLSGQQDITIGSIFANRANVRSWRTVGLFAHLVPLRLMLGLDLTVRDLLARGHEMMTFALANQELPMSLLPAGGVKRETALGVNNVVINVLPPGGKGSGQAGRERGIVPAPVTMPSAARFDFELVLLPRSSRLDFFVRYATDRFSPKWVEEFGHSLFEVIQAAAADVDVPLRQLRQRCLPRMESLAVLADWP